MLTSSISTLPSAPKHPFEGIANTGGLDSTNRSSGFARHAILRAIAGEVLGALGSDAGPQHVRGHHRRDDGDAGRGHGAAGEVARALKSALAKGGDSQALLAKVQEGLDAAQSRLVEQGFDPDEVAKAASQFTSRVASLLDGSGAPGAVASSEETATALSASVQIARKERGSLTLTTQDGDVLRIRFRNTERQSLELTSASTPGAQATSVSLSSSERSRTRVEVEGSLDAGELKAIEDFVGKVDALANEFFEGDFEAALAAAGSLDFDTEEIAGFSLKLSVSERIQASAVQTSVGGSQPVSGLRSQSAPVPSPQAPPVAEGVPAQTEAPTAVAPEATPTTPPAKAVQKDGLESIQTFVRKALAIADTPLAVSGYKLAWSAKLQLVSEAISVSGPREGKASGAAALSQLLDRVASAAGAGAPQTKLAEAA